MTDDLVARLRSNAACDVMVAPHKLLAEAADRLEAAETRVRELEAELADQRVIAKYNREQAEKAERQLAEAYERAAKIADEAEQESDGNASRECAANEIAAAIRNLAQEVKYEAD